jgi:hypothetical protein
MSAASRQKLSAQDAAAEATGRLQQKLTMAQQEVDMLRAAAEIEAAVRKELEENTDEVRKTAARKLCRVPAVRLARRRAGWL